MKWIFYVVVLIYMFYRTVYGAKVPDNHITLDSNGIKEGYIEVGETKTLICKGSSKNQKLQWLNPNGEVVPRQPSRRVYASHFFVQSMRSGPSLVLTLNGTAVEDSGVWTCKSGDVTEEVSICVMDTLTFEGTPAEVVADEGRSFTLSCQARGNPEPRISWLRNDEEISDDDKSGDDKYRLMTKYNSKGIEGLLTVMSLASEDSGIYTCKATQESHLADGCSVSEAFNITLNINHAPSFEEDDAKEKVYGKEAEILFIKCEADGYPQPTYRWFKKDDDSVTEFSESDIVASDDHTASVLQVKVTEDTYDKEYVCRAINKLGDAEKVFTILEPIEPETPSEVELVTAEKSDALIFNITWDDEILFDIDEIDAQYLRASQVRRRPKPRESDWKSAKKTSTTLGVAEDYGILTILSGLEKATEYWVRLRIRNTVGETKWSEAIKAATADEEDSEDEEKEEEEDEEENTSPSTSPSDEDINEESDASDDDLLITTESPQVSDESGKFYGLFFGVGIILLIVGCSFLMRIV